MMFLPYFVLFKVPVMLRLVLLLFYLHQSQAYSIKIQGNVDLGKDLGVLFKDALQNILRNQDGTTTIDLAKLMSMNFKPEIRTNKESFRNINDDNNGRKLKKTNEEVKNSRELETSDSIGISLNLSKLKDIFKKRVEKESTAVETPFGTSESENERPNKVKPDFETRENTNKRQRKEESNFKTSQKRNKMQSKQESESEENKSNKASFEDSDEDTSDNRIEDSKDDKKSERKVKNFVETIVSKEDIRTLHMEQSDIELESQEKLKRESEEKLKIESYKKPKSKSDEKSKTVSEEKSKTESEEKPKSGSDEPDNEFKEKPKSDSNEKHKNDSNDRSSKDTESSETQLVNSHELRMRFNTERRMNQGTVDAETNLAENNTSSAESFDTLSIP